MLYKTAFLADKRGSLPLRFRRAGKGVRFVAIVPTREIKAEPAGHHVAAVPAAMRAPLLFRSLARLVLRLSCP